MTETMQWQKIETFAPGKHEGERILLSNAGWFGVGVWSYQDLDDQEGWADEDGDPLWWEPTHYAIVTLPSREKEAE